VVGWWLYAEPLDLFAFAGAGLIISGIVWNLRNEATRVVRHPALPSNPQAPRAGGY
jgi:drug/metabolite transporter (DMT)-like permease